METYKDSTLSPEVRAADLLVRMTLEEKVAQIDIMRGVEYAYEASKMGYFNCTVEKDDSFDMEKLREAVGTRGIGYVHDIYSVPAIKNQVQKFLVEETRLGIPCIFTAEVLHGVSFAGASIFPVPLTLSQTFDLELIREIGDGIAAETRAIGHHEILAPNLDVARDPRWGRTEETFGEDTYLSSEMAVAIISGEQKGDISRKDSVIAEPKHYCVHGMPEGGLNCAPARVGQREVETCYLPVFEAGIKRGGAYNVMTSYNSVDGELVMTSEHGGEFGAKAIVEALAGDINPAGRLTVSYPRNEGMIPCYYSRLPGNVGAYIEGSEAPLYAFGHGLSYTGFTYSDLEVAYLSGYKHKVQVTVTNTGALDGDEVVQLYINDLESSIVTPDKLLRKFERISLKAGESKRIEFMLDWDDFKLLGLDWKWKVEPGDFDIMIGASSEDIRLNEIITIK